MIGKGVSDCLPLNGSFMILSIPLLILGLGNGLFTILVVALFSVCVCFLGAKSKRPGVYYCCGILLTLGIVLFFVYMPKGSTTTPQVYDHTYVPRVVAFIFLVFGLIVGFVATLKYFILVPIQGSRVRYSV